MSGGDEKLLPCPFCGGEAKLRDSRIFEKVPNWVAFCPVGHAMTPSYGEKDKAIKAWNTRPKPTLSLPGRKKVPEPREIKSNKIGQRNQKDLTRGVFNMGFNQAIDAVAKSLQEQGYEVEREK